MPRSCTCRFERAISGLPLGGNNEPLCVRRRKALNQNDLYQPLEHHFNKLNNTRGSRRIDTGGPVPEAGSCSLKTHI